MYILPAALASLRQSSLKPFSGGGRLLLLSLLVLSAVFSGSHSQAQSAVHEVRDKSQELAIRSAMLQRAEIAAAAHTPSLQHALLHQNGSPAENDTTEITVLSICFGESIKDARAALGVPDQTIAEGTKTILVYSGFRITFSGDRVTAVN